MPAITIETERRAAAKRAEALRCRQEADRHDTESARLRREAAQFEGEADRMINITPAILEEK